MVFSNLHTSRKAIDLQYISTYNNYSPRKYQNNSQSVSWNCPNLITTGTAAGVNRTKIPLSETSFSE